jgi:hypothetical protein
MKQTIQNCFNERGTRGVLEELALIIAESCNRFTLPENERERIIASEIRLYASLLNEHVLKEEIKP